MDFNRLQLFLQVARLGSMTKVAHEIGTVQPVVSRNIAALEEELHCRLFERTGRGMKLTQAGETFLPRVKQILDDVDTLIEDARSMAGHAVGLVRVGMVASFSDPLVGILLSAVSRDHPQINLRILEGSIGQIDLWLKQDLLDIGLIYRTDVEAVDGEEEVARMPSYLVGAANDPMLAEETVPFPVLKDLPIILAANRSSLRSRLTELARDAGVDFSPAIETNSATLNLKLAEMGQGYALLSLPAFIERYRRGKVSCARIVDPEMTNVVNLSYSNIRPPSVACRAVGATLKTIVHGLTSDGAWRGVPKSGIPGSPDCSEDT